MPPAFLHGCGLASALGPNLPAALACLQNGGGAPAQMEVGPGIVWPYFTIADEDADWYARARRLTLLAVAECGEVDRAAPLFLASCSLDVGAVEDGAPFLADGQAFAETVAGWLDWHGPIYWISTACTSASNALLAALASMQAGEAHRALVLGLELRNRFTSAGFGAMALLDTQRPRPLAADRAGLVLGEAVAALYLGTEPTRWRLCGGANVVEGNDSAGATPTAVAHMLELALADAGLAPCDIGLIKLQAAGSPGNDAHEIDGLRAAFGVGVAGATSVARHAWRRTEVHPAEPGTSTPALVSLKAELGHTLGASGAAELALLTACLEHGVWPVPRAAADPEIGVMLATQAPQVRYLLSTILGFGGGHAALVLEDCARKSDGDKILHRRDTKTQRAAENFSGWRIAGRCFAAPPPAEWREQLAARLGYKPRRIGRWAELVLYGALRCLEDAGETTLPTGALLSLSSLNGPEQALRNAVTEARDGQPMPLGFLQSQQNQALAHLAKALDWQGDARCLSTRDPLAALRLACASAGQAGLLLGWVEEAGEGCSQWLRLVPAEGPAFAPLPDTLAALGKAETKGFRL